MNTEPTRAPIDVQPRTVLNRRGRPRAREPTTPVSIRLTHSDHEIWCRLADVAEMPLAAMLAGALRGLLRSR